LRLRGDDTMISGRTEVPAGGHLVLLEKSQHIYGFCLLPFRFAQ
jgi:hypothetical protein